MSTNGGTAQPRGGLQPAPPTDGNGAPARRPHVVVIGGGFGGLAAARRLSKAPVRLTVVDRLNYHLFQPLLYQVALAGLSAADVAMPIRSILARSPNTEVVLAEVASVQLESRTVVLTDGGKLNYDFLVLAAGARTSYFGHDAWSKTAPGLKNLDDALEIRRRVLLALELAERTPDEALRRRLLTFAIIGGGPTGVELAGAIADLSGDILQRDFRRARRDEVRVVLIERAPRVLTPFTPHLSARAATQLEELRVELRTGTSVTNIDEHGVWLDGGDLVPAATVLWAAGVAPSPITATLGVPLDRGGRVIVSPDCSLPGHPEAFAIGDLAHFTEPGADQALPGISPVAIQQGRAVADNIRRLLRGKAPRPFRYFDKGFMATIGRARAVAMLRRLQLSGFVAWLAWVFVHLFYLVGFRNRAAVFLNWTWSYLFFRHGARLVTGTPHIPPAQPDDRASVTTARPPTDGAAAPPG